MVDFLRFSPRTSGIFVAPMVADRRQGGPTPEETVVLRITWMDAEAVPGTAKVEGEIAGEHVHELFRFAASALERVPRIMLDLSDVTFVDHSGAVLLRALRDQGVEFVDGSSFISSLVSGLTTALGTGGAE
jgi:ABC-type transporter Mla MlaB component